MASGSSAARSDAAKHGTTRPGAGAGGGDVQASAQDSGARATEGPHHSARWSLPVSLKRATTMAPVMIRLEEGHRGAEEELSLSAGDTLVLDGVTERRGRRMVMGYYLSDMIEDNADDEERKREEEAGEEGEVCKAFLLLPCDSLPPLDVRVLEDWTEQAYRSFLGRHFSHRNWARHRQELLEEMGDQTYINVSTIIANLCQRPSFSSSSSSSTSAHKEPWSLQPARRPPPAPPSRLGPTSLDPLSSGVRGEGGAQSPPPRPPRSLHPSASEKGTGVPAPSTLPDADKPPPRPPRRLLRPTPTAAIKDEEEEGEVFAMPSLAEMFTSGQFFVDPDEKSYDYYLTPKARVVLPEPPPHAKNKSESVLAKMKTLGKKFYVNMGKTTSKFSVSSQSSQDGGEDAPTPSSTPSAGEKSDDSSDEDEYYTMIDEDMMDPDAPPWSEKTKKDGETKPDAGKVNKSKAAGKAATSAAVKPMVLVHPQERGGRVLTSKSSTPTPVQREGRSPHPMMAVFKPNTSVEEADEEPEKSVTSGRLQDMTCFELCNRLRQCGMPELARVCQGKSIDGPFFCALTDEALKEPPFSLASFDVDAKLKMVKAGWVPK